MPLLRESKTGDPDANYGQNAYQNQIAFPMNWHRSPKKGSSKPCFSRLCFHCTHAR
jgi:hypothetical protein